MWYWIFRILFLGLFKTCFTFKVEGSINLPAKNNFIIVSNHASWMDPIILGVAINRRIHYIAMRSLYRIKWLKWFVKLLDALPTGASSQKAIQLLNHNKNIGLFPEGGCTADGKLRNFKRGAALLAVKTGRPVVPCAVTGSFQSFPRTARFPKLLLPIKVTIGRPIYLLKEFDEIIDDSCLQKGTFRIQNAVTEILKRG